MKFSETFDKTYLIRAAVTALTAALAIGVIAYAGYHLAERFSPGLELVDAIPTAETRIIEADCYILRNEKPLYSGSVTAGSVVPAVSDGGRIPFGGRIVDVYAESAPDIENRIAEIDEQIRLLEANQGGDHSVQNTSGLDAEIYEGVFDIVSDCAAGEFADAVSLRTSLLVDIQKKAILTGEFTDYTSQISRLESERSSLRSRLGSCLESVTASETGYYFSEYDGYGGVFSADKIDTMTFDEFETMTEAEPEAGSGLCLGVLVKDYRWYIACRMSKEEAGELADEYTCTVRFPYSGERLDMTVYRVVGQTPGSDAVVILQCEKLPQHFDFTRMQPVQIEVAEYTGYEFPRSAIRVLDDCEGVYILDEVTVEFRRITVIYEFDDKVICVGNDMENARIAEEVSAARLERVEELVAEAEQEARDEYYASREYRKAVKKAQKSGGSVPDPITEEVEKQLISDANAQAKQEINEETLGYHYWISRNDIIIAGGRGLEDKKIVPTAGKA